jgi:hypothetical protein
VSTGACKVCQSSIAKALNKRLARGDSYTKVIAWAADNDFSVSKPTLISHKKHITDPKTTVVDEARKNPVIKRVGNDEFLQALVDIGAARIAEHPEDVSVDQSIRAAQTLAQKGDKRIDVLVLLAERLSPKALEPVIEGDWRELEMAEGHSIKGEDATFTPRLLS